MKIVLIVWMVELMLQIVYAHQENIAVCKAELVYFHVMLNVDFAKI